MWKIATHLSLKLCTWGLGVCERANVCTCRHICTAHLFVLEVKML